MANQVLNLARSLQKLTISKWEIPAISSLCNNERAAVLYNQTRTSTNFFNKLPAADLWKGITSVSNAGKKRGRAKNVSKSKIKDLNRGQIIGVGRANIIWPGLSVPIIRGKELVEQQQLPEDPNWDQKLTELRDKMGTFKHPRLSPIDRGWSGSKMPGRSIGPPDPVGEDTFDGFDTKVLELKMVFCMKGNLGRTRRISCLVVTGNKNGVAGFALAKSAETKAVLRKAKNRAGQKLMYIKRYKDHTVCHDFFAQFGETKIYVSKKPEGYGLVCHRAIKTICEVIGIKNLHAKVEGSTNVNKIMKAFFMGLLKQKTPDEIAEEKKLHLVEICKENHYFPTVIASPKECRKASEISKDEILDFTQYCYGGRVVLKKKTRPPFYANYRSYEIYLKKFQKYRNQHKVRHDLISEYGQIQSFLHDQYPECQQYYPERKKNEEAAVE